MDMDLRLNLTSRDSNSVPFWSLKNLLRRQEQDYYEFEVIAEKNDIKEEQADVDADLAIDVAGDDAQQSPTNFNKYKCHICNIDVPKIYVSEHNDSMKHRNNILLAKSALERINKQVGEPLLKCLQACESNAESYFCEPCVKIINNRDKKKHECSRAHAAFVKHDHYLRKFMEIYVETDPELLLKKIQDIDSIETSVNVEIKGTYKNTEKEDNILHRLNENDVVRIKTDQKSGKILRVPTLSIHEKTSRGKADDDILFSRPDTETTDTQCEEQTDRHTYYQMKETDNPKELLCTVCKVKVPNTTFNIHQHIQSLKHVSKLTSSNIEDTYYCVVCRDYIPKRDFFVHCCIEKHNIVKKSKNKIAYPNLENITTEKRPTKQNMKLPTVNATNNDTTKVNNVKGSISVGNNVDGSKVKDLKLTNKQHLSDLTIVKNKGNQNTNTIDEDAYNEMHTKHNQKTVTDTESKGNGNDQLFEFITTVNFEQMLTKNLKKSRSEEDKAFKKHIMSLKKWYPIYTHDVSITSNNKIKIETFYDGKEVIVPVENFNGYAKQTQTTVNCKLCGLLLYNHETQEMHKFTPIHSRNVMSEVTDVHCIRKYKYWNHCMLCNETVKNIDIDEHKNSQEHARRLKEALVTRLDTDSTESSNNVELIVNTSITKDKEVVKSDATKINYENEENEVTKCPESNISYDKRTNVISSDICDKSHLGEQNNNATNEKRDLTTAPNIRQETGEIMATVTGTLKKSITFCDVCNLTVLDNDLALHLIGKKHNKALSKFKQLQRTNVSIIKDKEIVKSDATKINYENEENEVTKCPESNISYDKRANVISSDICDKSHLGEQNNNATNEKRDLTTAPNIRQGSDEIMATVTGTLKRSTTFCDVCNLTVLDNDLALHLIGKKHNKALSKLKNVTDKPNESHIETVASLDIDNKRYKNVAKTITVITEREDENKRATTTVQPETSTDIRTHEYKDKNQTSTIKLRNSTHCEVCNLDILANDLTTHLKSKKHSKALRKLETHKIDSQGNTVATIRNNTDYKLDYQIERINTYTLKCKVCDIWFRNTTVEISKHLQSIKHSFEYARILFNNRIKVLNYGFFCDFCTTYIYKTCELDHIQCQKHKFLSR